MSDGSPAAKAAAAAKYARADAAGYTADKKTSKALSAAAKSIETASGKPADNPADNPMTLLEMLQAPYERRVERAGGAPFEGPVDWNGIAAAIFGGQNAEARDAAILAGRAPAAPRFDPINPDGGPSWEQFDDYVNNTDAFGPRVDPESGFIRDPETGTYYRADLAPGRETRLAENPVASQLPSFAPLQGLMDGINAEVARTSPTALPPLPRPDPRGGIADMATPLPGQVEGGREPIEIEVRGGNGIESDEARYAREHPVETPKKKTVFDNVVEGAGGLLEHTALGGAVKTLFPDLWYGAGETIKGMDDGVTYGGSGPQTNFEYLENGGSLSSIGSGDGGGGYYGPPPAPFPDLNGNGIDDRLEGFTPSVNFGNRTAVFPDLPPYNPGRDNEWRYFRGPQYGGMATGGLVQAYAEGGEVSPLAGQDPRVELIADAEDVLEAVAAGQKPGPAEEKTLRAFVAEFGDDMLRKLNDQVKAGMKMRSPRMINGPGTGTSDSVPAVIEDAPGGPQPAALSDGELVMTADAVLGAGEGDRERGAEKLMQLNDALAGRKVA